MYDKLELRAVSKVFQTVEDGTPFTALRDINLRVAGREFLVVVGRSGCGKTTLLRLIAGLERPSKGEIWGCTASEPRHWGTVTGLRPPCSKESERFAHDR